MRKAIISVFLFSIFGMGCNSDYSFDDWANVVSQQKTAVLNQMNNTPYKKEQQDTLKTYFRSISDFAITLSADESVRKAVNKRLLKEDLGSLCSRVLLEKETWKVIVKNCSKNQFFLCAEEVRKYDSYLSVIQSQLQPSVQVEAAETKCATFTGSPVSDAPLNFDAMLSALHGQRSIAIC